MILSGRELGLLINYLSQIPELQVATPDTRRNLLVLSGLGDLVNSVHITDELNLFVQTLVAKAVEKRLIIGQVERLGLAVFLDYLLSSPIGNTMLPLHQQFFQGIVDREAQQLEALRRHQKLQQEAGWPPPDLPAPGEDAPLAAPGGNGAERRHIPVDRDLLIGFNLVPLHTRLVNSLQNYRGAFAFAVGGREADETVLRGYIIERLLKEVESITGREYRKFEYSINKYMVLQPDRLLETSLREPESPARVSDMVSASTQDLVLVFYNYDIPVRTVKQLAQAFWECARLEAEAFVNEGGRCFIVLWVNVREKPLRLDQVVTLPIPDRFEVDILKTYVKGRLGKYRDRLSDQVIERYLLRLALPQGHLANTYREISGMISELQDGRW